MLVQELLAATAARLPQKTALVCDGQRLTYFEIDAMSNRLANAMRANGVKRGDRVALFLPNSIAFVIAIFAALKSGAVFVPINHTTKRDKLIYILNNCGATAFCTDSRGAALACGEQIGSAVPSMRLVVLSGRDVNFKGSGKTSWIGFEQTLQEFRASSPPQSNIDLDLACLIYTSGSTGDPKGVMSDHRNVVFATNSITQYLENVQEDIVMNVLPMSFDYGLYQLLMTFKFGGTLVLENGFAFPSAILKRMDEERVTGFPGVPTIFAMLLQLDLSAYDLSCLRYITNTAAALPPSHIEELRQKFHWVKLFSMYGLTETKRTLYLPPDQLDRRPGSVGIPIPGTETWIEDENGNRLGPGSIGELVVRGSHVMRGYWMAPEKTERRFRPGALPGERVCYTGDLFRMDEDGYFYFVGRKDDIIKSRGEKISPKEIENVLYQIRGVVEAAVVGVPDPILGHAIKAIIVAKNNHLSAVQVLAHCRAHLEDYMVPKHIEFRTELPKTSSGKIQKTGLN